MFLSVNVCWLFNFEPERIPCGFCYVGKLTRTIWDHFMMNFVSRYWLWAS